MEAPLHQPPHDATVAVADNAVPPRQAAGRREQCPRCASRDTKFCYYNNYNTAQPRHFCRSCRRYWTLGGSLRNVPVGGSVRKRPRPARPARAAVCAAAAAALSTATATSSPFVSSAAAPAAMSAGQLSDLFGSLPLLAFGAAPLLEGRLGCFDLGLGQPRAGDAGFLGFGAAPLLWPSMIFEGDRADTWKGSGVFPSAAWQELAAAAAVEAGGLHHGAPGML